MCFLVATQGECWFTVWLLTIQNIAKPWLAIPPWRTKNHGGVVEAQRQSAEALMRFLTGTKQTHGFVNFDVIQRLANDRVHGAALFAFTRHVGPLRHLDVIDWLLIQLQMLEVGGDMVLGI